MFDKSLLSGIFTNFFMPDFDLFNFIFSNYFKKFSKSLAIVVFIILKVLLNFMFSKGSVSQWVKHRLQTQAARV